MTKVIVIRLSDCIVESGVNVNTKFDETERCRDATYGFHNDVKQIMNLTSSQGVDVIGSYDEFGEDINKLDSEDEDKIGLAYMNAEINSA